MLSYTVDMMLMLNAGVDIYTLPGYQGSTFVAKAMH